VILAELLLIVRVPLLYAGITVFLRRNPFFEVTILRGASENMPTFLVSRSAKSMLYLILASSSAYFLPSFRSFGLRLKLVKLR